MGWSEFENLRGGSRLDSGLGKVLPNSETGTPRSKASKYFQSIKKLNHKIASKWTKKATDNPLFLKYKADKLK